MERTREIIIQLLENVGGRKEVAEYLRLYRSFDSRRFAIITFTADVDVAASADEVASALTFLHFVGLYPIVVVSGARPAKSLSLALEACDCDVERVKATDAQGVVSAIERRALPVIGVDFGLVAAVRDLALHLEPHKLILLDNVGGLRGRDGELVSAINLAEDEAHLSELLDEEQRSRLERYIPLLEDLPNSLSLSVTSPSHLARELFTHRGAGTLVKHGERVVRHDDFGTIDEQRLRELIASCFGRELATDYFESKRCHRVYLTESYRATAILTASDELPPYLDKFAVTRKAQGEGLGASLWARIRADHARLFWRARSDNPVNRWYFDQADGSVRSGRWTVFWYGISGFEEIERCVAFARDLPATLVE
jgi:acetylglutamate synthase